MNNFTTKRDSRFELLRIIAMVMIVMFHTANTIKTTMTMSDGDWLKVHLLGAWGICGVDIFVVISALFFFKKHELNGKSCVMNGGGKIQKLIFQTLFYIIAWYIAVHFLNHQTINTTLSILIQDIFCAPLFLNHYWFIWPYIGMQLALPYINKIKPSIVNLLVAISLLIVSNNNSSTCVIVETVHFVLISIIVLHIVRIKQLNHVINKYCGYGVLFTTLLILSSSYASYYLSNHQFIQTLQPIITRIHIYGSRFSFLMIINAIFLVFCFEKIKKFRNSCINYIATLMFGVYLFHTFLMCDFTHIVIPYIKYITNDPLLILIESSSLIMIIGCAIEITRKIIFNNLTKR